MIKRAAEIDAPALAKLAIQMWSSHTLSELASDFAEIIGNENAVCFMKYVEGNRYVLSSANSDMITLKERKHHLLLI